LGLLVEVKPTAGVGTVGGCCCCCSAVSPVVAVAGVVVGKDGIIVEP